MLDATDNRVLSQLMLLQGTLDSMTTDESISRFVFRGLKSILGVRYLNVCIRGAVAEKNDLCTSCNYQWGEPEDNCVHLCKLEDYGNTKCLPINTISCLYGFMVFSLNDTPDAFTPYEPYLQNVVNIIALSLDNKQQRHALEAFNKQLQREVEHRKQAEEELRMHQIELEMQNKELQQVRAELELSRVRYFNLYDLAPVGYCTLSEKGLIQEANLTTATLLGVARGKLVKQPLTRFIFPADQDIYYLNHKQLFETGEPQVCELRIVHRDETIFWAHLEATVTQEADGLPVCRVTINDSPEQKRAEEELRDRLRFEMLFADISTRFTNITHLQIDIEIELALNDILQFFKVDRAGLLKVSMKDQSWQITHASHRDDILPVSIGSDLPAALFPWIYERVVRKQEIISFSTLEELPEEADADRQTYLKWGVKSCLNIPISIGKDYLYVIFLNTVGNRRSWPDNYVPRLRLLAEITVNTLERRRIETEAIISRRELMKKERIFQMGELTASLAHELNQPLMAILSNARAALRFMQNDRFNVEELKEILEDIVSDDKRAGEIIRSLRSMVKPEEGERELIAIDAVLHEAVSIFNSEAIIRNIKVETDYDNSVPLVNIDKVQLQQVVINLMMNAAESMVHIMQNRRIVIQKRVIGGKRVSVAVRDFGIGIEKKEAARVFESFFTTKRSGLGMGLSLSRSIIEAHGGHIWLENNPDGGATFLFDLPLANEA